MLTTTLTLRALIVLCECGGSNGVSWQVALLLQSAFNMLQGYVSSSEPTLALLVERYPSHVDAAKDWLERVAEFMLDEAPDLTGMRDILIAGGDSLD